MSAKSPGSAHRKSAENAQFRGRKPQYYHSISILKCVAVLSVQSQLVSNRRNGTYLAEDLGHERLPLGQGDRAAGFVGLSVYEVAVLVEVIVNVGMD